MTLNWELTNEFDSMLLQAHPLNESRRSRKADGILRLSWSLLKSGLTCPRAATWTTYPEKFSVPEDATKFSESLSSIRGNMVQALLEHIYAHNFPQLEPDKFVQAVQASWRWSVKFFTPLRIISSEELENLRIEVFTMLPTILKTLNDEGIWANRQAVEKPLWWDVSHIGGLRLTGKADFVLQDPGKYWLIDGKVVNNPNYLDPRQLLFYALILNKMTGRTPDRILFWLYPQGEVVDHSAALHQDNFNGLMHDIEKVFRQIKSFDETPNPTSYNCRLCMHRTFCDSYKCSF